VSDQIIQRFMSKVMESMVDLAEGTMMSPPDGEFRIGQAAGRYQGLRQSLDILNSILADNEEKERRS
jgi:hypothetical protein